MYARSRGELFHADTVTPVAQDLDANDMIYQFEASRDYDPPADLGKITAPLLPITADSRGHGTRTLPAMWGEHLRGPLSTTRT